VSDNFPAVNEAAPRETLGSRGSCMQRLRRRSVRWAAVAITATCLSGLASASNASAYVHRWGDVNPENCSYDAAYDQCWDWSGQGFNPWVRVDFAVAYGPNDPGSTSFNGVCAKAQTSSGTQKGGSTCTSTGGAIAWLTASPQSQAYGYWGGSGPAPGLQGGYATT
jgi:hypothetical protein